MLLDVFSYQTSFDMDYHYHFHRNLYHCPNIQILIWPNQAGPGHLFCKEKRPEVSITSAGGHVVAQTLRLHLPLLLLGDRHVVDLGDLLHHLQLGKHELKLTKWVILFSASFYIQEVKSKESFDSNHLNFVLWFKKMESVQINLPDQPRPCAACGWGPCQACLPPSPPPSPSLACSTSSL